MAIGRPISLTPNIATKAINSVATANQTEFTVTGGYRINELAVYRNGVRLAQGRDFTANDGTTVTLTNGATLYDVIEFVIFDSFDVAGTIVSAASSQTLSGDLNVTGKLYGGTVDTDSLNIGVGTFVSAVHVGTAITIDAAGNTNTTGIVTAASFSGDGSALVGLANTDFVVSVATTTGNLNVSAAATITGALTGSTGTFSGAVNVDATTDSTSSSTGALIVDGGLGVAKNVYIGAGLSVAGTLTYEDVTNVDSVGLITAKSGVNVSGGQVTIGTGITMGIAGVATFSGTSDVHLHDNVKLNVGDASDLSIYHDGSHSYIADSGTGRLHINTSQLRVNNAADNEILIDATENTGVSLYDGANTVRFATTNDGTVTTGICSATDFSGLSGGAADFPNALTSTTVTTTGNIDIDSDSGKLRLGADQDFDVFHDGTHGNIDNNTGELRVDSVSAVKISHNSNLIWYTESDRMRLNDSVSIDFGNSSDLRIYHDGTQSIINDSNNKLQIRSDLIQLMTASGKNEYYFQGTEDGAANLYYDNSLKLATTTSGISVTGAIVDSTHGNVRDIPATTKSSGYTLVASDFGKVVYTSTGGVTIPNSVMSGGNVVTIVNNSSSNQTITQASGLTLYNTADATTGNRTLAGRGMCTIWFQGGSTAYISGAGLS